MSLLIRKSRYNRDDFAETGETARINEAETPENRPNSLILFWTFRFMIAIGFLFLFIMILAGYLWRRGRLFENRIFLRTLVLIQPLGFIATELGWITTEMGRQPWLVYNVMRVSEGISPISPGNVVWSLALFLVIFPIILTSYFYYVFKTLLGGPDLQTPIPLIQRPAGMLALTAKDGEGGRN